MNLGCVVSNDGPVLTFFMQLMAYPAFSLSMLAVWAIIGKCQAGVSAGLFNMNGLVLMTLYAT